MALCHIRWCETDVGDSRRYCSEHILRDWEHFEARFLDKYHWHVFATVGDDTPVYLIGLWKSSSEAGRQKTLYHGLPDPMHEDRPLIVFYVHDGNSMSDPHMAWAIQQAMDTQFIAEGKGGDLLMPKTKAKEGGTAKKSATPKECLCGCGDMTGGGRFLPGHDAKLKGSLIREVREARENGNSKAETKAVEQLEELGWGNFVPDAEADEARAAKRKEKVASLAEAKAKKGKAAKGKKAAAQ